MLKDLKVAFLVYKSVFYQLEQISSKGNKILKVLKCKNDIPTDKAQRADEKNGVIFLVIMFLLTKTR